MPVPPAKPGRSRWLFLTMVLALVSLPLGAQTTLKLPLPVDSPTNALAFDVQAPPAGVLSGLLLPASGPLIAWAPVWSTLRVDGSLKEGAEGGWTGPRPDRWLKVVKPGFVVGGFRVLVRTTGGTVQTRQVQVFWRPWVEGSSRGPVTTSRVYGEPAGPTDSVRIIELTVPEGAVPTGLWGETVGSQVAQVSLVLKAPPAPETKAPVSEEATKGPRPPVPSVQPEGPPVPPLLN